MARATAGAMHPLTGLFRVLASLFPAALVTWLLFLFMAMVIAVDEPANVPDRRPVPVTIPSAALEKREPQPEVIIIIGGAPAPGEPYRMPSLLEMLGEPDPPDIARLDPNPSWSAPVLRIPRGGFYVPRGQELELISPAYAACFAEGETMADTILRYDVDPEGRVLNIRLLETTNACMVPYAICELSTWSYPGVPGGQSDLIAVIDIYPDDRVIAGSACAGAAAP